MFRTNITDQPVQIDNSNFDVRSYVAKYKGRTRIQRLMCVADRCPSAKEPATKLLMQAAEATGVDAIIDTRLYREIFKYGKLYLVKSGEPNEKYIKQMTQKNTARRTKLEDNIQKFRNLSLREKCGRSHLQLGDFLCKNGEFDLAIRKIGDAKEFATLSKELVECQVKIIFTSVKQGSFSHVQTEAARLFAANPGPEAFTDVTRSQIQACMGLDFLRNKKFVDACGCFLRATRLGIFNEIITKRDVGIYGALCALAVLSRDELKKQLLDNDPIMGYLDRAPEMKKLVYAMYDSKYNVVMETLRNMGWHFKHDYYLHDLAEMLVHSVRGSALVQYFKPFSCIKLSRMAKDFGVEVALIEEELHQAILKGQVKGKIDLANRTLSEYQDVPDQQTVLQTVVEEGEAFCREATSVMCSLSLTANRMELNKSHLSDFPRMHHNKRAHRGLGETLFKRGGRGGIF